MKPHWTQNSNKRILMHQIAIHGTENLDTIFPSMTQIEGLLGLQASREVTLIF